MDNLLGSEVVRISNALQDGGDRIVGMRDQTIRRKLSIVGATSQELELRCTWALTDANSTSELNKITSRDVAISQNR